MYQETILSCNNQANYYSCVNLAYSIQFAQRFYAKYFLQNLKIFVCSHFIAQNVQQGLILKMPNTCVVNGNAACHLAVTNTERSHLFRILKM